MRLLRRLFGSARLGLSRSALVLLVVSLGVVAVFAVVSSMLAWRGYQQARAAAESDVGASAAAAAAEVDRFLDGRADALRAIAASPAVRRLALDEMQAYFDSLPEIAGLGAVSWSNLDGRVRVVSGGIPAEGMPDVRDSDFFTGAAGTRGTVFVGPGTVFVGRAVAGPVTGQLTVPIAVASEDLQGKRTGVVLGGILLNGRDAGPLHFGGIPGLRVIGFAGDLLIDVGHAVQEVRDVTAWPGYAQARSGGNGVLTGVPGLLGEPGHVVGFAATRTAGWLVLSDRPAEAVYGAPYRRFRTEVEAIAVFVIASLAGISWSTISLEHRMRSERAAREAVDAARSLHDTFIDTLTHDLRSPLTIIRANADLLQRDLRRSATASASDRADDIRRAAMTIDRMVEDFTDLQHGDEQLPLNLSTVDLVELAGSVVALAEHANPDRGIRFEPAVDGLTGHWDRERLARVVDNLLSNALKYSPASEPVIVQVEPDPAPPGEWAVVRVIDLGIGIPRPYLKRIFEPYVRATNAAGVRGTGLGLASVHQIVQAHGGMVTADSREGAGSVFTVKLPIALDTTSKPPEPGQGPASSAWSAPPGSTPDGHCDAGPPAAIDDRCGGDSEQPRVDEAGAAPAGAP
ncbi:MAG: ATP-binding protein [Dehalococcoidia bacterium]